MPTGADPEPLYCPDTGKLLGMDMWPTLTDKEKLEARHYMMALRSRLDAYRFARFLETVKARAPKDEKPENDEVWH